MVKRHLSLKNYGSVSNNPQGKAAHARIVNGFKITLIALERRFNEPIFLF